MVLVDRWLVLGILGFASAIVFAVGEFLGWWDLLGEFGFWFSVAMGLMGMVVNASRSQGQLLLAGLRELHGGTGRVEAGLGRVEQGVGRVEQGLGRVEQGVGRIEAHTAESARLLRDIRDALAGR